MTHDELQMLLDSTPLMMGIAWNLIIPALTSLAGMFMGGGSSGSGGNSAQQMSPEMQQMLQMQLKRMRGQEPLYNDVMGMARSLLPTRYRTAPGGRTDGDVPWQDSVPGKQNVPWQPGKTNPNSPTTPTPPQY